MANARESEGGDDDADALRRLGYTQELSRRMSGFSNFAMSLSIICILAGGITSFHIGLSSTGGSAIGLGWPLATLLSLAVAATMGQIASAFPTAGGLYHWASILGGRGFGWLTAWLNLLGLVAVLAAINVGTWLFAVAALGPKVGFDPAALDETTRTLVQAGGVAAITLAQALVNHLGIRATTRLTDFSGYWILFVAAALTVSMLAWAPSLHPERLVEIVNLSGAPGGEVWPATSSTAWLFLLGLLLPAYTITGFDASAHASEETMNAARNVPRGIVRSVLVSGVAGFLMLAALVVGAPDLAAAAAKGEGAFFAIVDGTLPAPVATALYAGIVVAQLLCGLATVTSASRMTFAFARDGGLPASRHLRRVSARHRVPATAIWTVALLAIAFTLYTPVYSTITTVCVILLYLSYVLPTLLGLFAYGRTWTRMGPWTLGRAFRPLAALSIAACALLVVLGVQPPNDKALWIVGALALVMAVVWFAGERRRFRGPPGVRGKK